MALHENPDPFAVLQCCSLAGRNPCISSLLAGENHESLAVLPPIICSLARELFFLHA